MKLFKRKKKEPQTVEVNGKQLKCTHCDNEYFWQKSFQLNTSFATFFGLDWTNRSSTTFVCSECTYIHWFDS